MTEFLFHCMQLPILNILLCVASNHCTPFKDSIFTDIFTLVSKETEIANVYKDLVLAQMEYHRTALQKLENVLPEIDRKIGTFL